MMDGSKLLRNFVKSAIDSIAAILAFPWVAMSRLEALRGAGYNHLFNGCGQFFALIPGVWGLSVRRAFYRGTLKHCAKSAYIGFGVIISKRESILEERVFINNYALLGMVILREGCMIGSRASIVSQGVLHKLDDQGRWVTPDNLDPIPTEIGSYAWIGEGAIIAANVGQGSMVSAGAVVSNPIPPRVMVAGNPARFVKHLTAEPKS